MTANVHVLRIDDDQGTMEFLTEVLQKEGYAVDAAKTGQEALAQTRAFAFDVVLADLRLPDLDGIEVLRTLHTLDPDLPVIVMTAFGSMETAVEAIRDGEPVSGASSCRTSFGFSRPCRRNTGSKTS